MATAIKMTPTLKDEDSIRFNRELGKLKPTDSSKERIESLVLKVLLKNKKIMSDK